MQYINAKNLYLLALAAPALLLGFWAFDGIQDYPAMNQWGLPADEKPVWQDSVTHYEDISAILAHLDKDSLFITEVKKRLMQYGLRQSGSEESMYRVFAPQHHLLQLSNNPGPFLVYEESFRNFVALDLNSGSISQIPKRREVEWVEASGIIDGSLYETIERNDLPISMVNRLTEIFAWEIDFYRLNAGDRFKLIYEREFIDGVPVGYGDIIAAEFHHKGQGHYGFRFFRDSSWSYYDQGGNPLKKAFLQAPLDYIRITSGYNTRRFHPILKRVVEHLGTDYAAPLGTPIRSVGDGTVVMSGYAPNSGLNVKIRHSDEYSTGYLHMSRIAAGLKPGRKVVQGEVIGYVGATGMATGPHLCFRFWKNGKQVDPYKEDFPEKEGIEPSRKDFYTQYTSKLKKRLDSIPYDDKSILAVN